MDDLGIGSRPFGSRGRRRRSSGTRTIFSGIGVFDGERFLDAQDVLVNGAVIEACGDTGTVSPLDAVVIPGSGRTLLPGFIDAHVHIGLHKPRRVLRHGVTTVRDLGAPLEQLAGVQRDTSESTRGPLVLFAGQMLTAPDGYPSRAGWAAPGTAREVRSHDDARDAVAEQIAAGASVIKVALDPRQGPALDRETLRVIVASASPLRVTAHVGSLRMLEQALDAGVAELAHGLWSDEKLPDSTIRRMVDAGVTVVPTLHIDASSARLDALRRFHQAGGAVLYGTDMGNPPTPGGIDADELALMLEAGMSLEQGLSAATSIAAAYHGLEGRGWIRAGAAADVVMVKGDPRKKLKGLGAPLLVMRNGRVVA